MIELMFDSSQFCVPGRIDRTPAAVVEAFDAAYNAHDIDGVAATISAAATFGRSGATISAEELLSNYRDIVFERFPDAAVATLESVKIGNVVARIDRTTGVGEPDSGLSVFTVVDGCIVGMLLGDETSLAAEVDR